jgi:uridylate kinase
LDTAQPKYKRVLLKLSGEALAGGDRRGIESEVLKHIAGEIAEAHEAGVDIGIVPGGGNIFRGGSDAKRCELEEYTGHYMGMLATVINGLALQGALETRGIQTRLMTAIEMREVAEPYIQRRALRHLEKRRIVIFAAGTGHPFFTTDTAAVLRSVQMNAEVIFKGTDVDGVYDDDPDDKPDARLFETLEYLQVLAKGYKVMDATAISLSMERQIPIIVFNMNVPGNISRALQGQRVGTTVS